MVAIGFLGLFVIYYVLYGDVFESELKNAMFRAYKPYLYGLALLTFVLGGVVLRANGVDINLFQDK